MTSRKPIAIGLAIIGLCMCLVSGSATAQGAADPGQEASPDVDAEAGLPLATDAPEEPAAAPDPSPGDPGPWAEAVAPAEVAPAADEVAPAADEVAPAADELAPAVARGSAHSESLSAHDVEPTITVYQRGDVALRLGGLFQLQLAPWVGADSLVTNSDVANREGFRLRRVRLGAETWFARDLRLLIIVNPLESDPDVGTLAAASIKYVAAPWLHISAGTGKVPLSRGGLESSHALASIERPLSVRKLVPDRRLGVTFEGELLARRLGYMAALMNATEGYERGNQFGGLLYAGRLHAAVWGQPDLWRPGGDGVVLGLGALFEDGPATRTVAASADVMLVLARAMARLEILCDRTTPKDAPLTSPNLADAIERCGAYLELGYALPRWSLQPVLRVEIFDDDRAVQDAGDMILASIGVNAALHAYVRAQLHYLHRSERFSTPRDNDALVLSLQGHF